MGEDAVRGHQLILYVCSEPAIQDGAWRRIRNALPYWGGEERAIRLRRA
jgi:hypothetical protein